LGGTDVLDGLWRRLGIDVVMTRLLHQRRITSPVERVLFGLVAGRALAPSSKLAAAGWITGDVHIDGLPETSDDVCYRAMDRLHERRGALEKELYHQVADLLNLEVDLLFFDTTSTYFEVEEADMPLVCPSPGTGAANPSPNPSPNPATATATATATASSSAPGSARTASPRTPGMICRRS